MNRELKCNVAKDIDVPNKEGNDQITNSVKGEKICLIVVVKLNLR